MQQGSRTRVAVVGASGYAGEELLSRLMSHPEVELTCLTSRQYAGKRLEEVYPRFAPGNAGGGRQTPTLVPPDAATIVKSGAEFAFLALPHGLAAEFAVPLLADGVRVIDLSADFRLRDASVYKTFYEHDHPAPELLAEAVYGLPELGPRRAEIAAARLVAAPGCYPTSILVPLFPLLRLGLIEPGEILISSMSGVSGAGRKASVDLLFGEVNESSKAYGVPRHRHLSEIEQELSSAAGKPVIVNFTPHLIPVTRGILTTIYTRPLSGAAPGPGALEDAWRQAYGAECFVRLLGGAGLLPEIAHVSRTNYIELACRHDPRTGRWILFSAIDNLVKGAAGQAIQCFNLMAGWPEATGLS